MRSLAVLLVAAVSVAGAAALRDTTDAAPSVDHRPTAETHSPILPQTAAPPGVARATVDAATGVLVRTDQIAAAGRRQPTVVAPATHGIRCPDGTCLPLLNGVDNAPAIIRASEHGPLPPVVAITVDAAGFDWYEHADGSMTTCRPQFVTDAQGRRAIQVITIHTAGAPADGAITGLPADGTAPR